MATVISGVPRSATIESVHNPVYQAYQALHIGFVVAPIAAGVDKFLHYLTNWEMYLAPQVAAIVPAATFMKIVGVVEIVAGIIVLAKPKIGGAIVCAWLLGIIVNLLMAHGFYDVALRDLGLAIGAFALSRLGAHFEARRASAA